MKVPYFHGKHLVEFRVWCTMAHWQGFAPAYTARVNILMHVTYMGHKAPKHVDLSTNKVFRHILAQKSYANNIKTIKHVRKQGDMLEKL